MPGDWTFYRIAALDCIGMDFITPIASSGA